MKGHVKWSGGGLGSFNSAPSWVVMNVIGTDAGVGGVLTTVQTGDPQGLGCVKGQTVLAVLDIGHGRHGVEVGLQGQLVEVAPGLNLWRKIRDLFRDQNT